MRCFSDQTVQAPFFFLPPSACLALDLRVVVFSLGMLGVLRDGLAWLTRLVRVAMVIDASGEMMWITSRPDVTSDNHEV